MSQAFAVRRFILGSVLSFMPLVAARAQSIEVSLSHEESLHERVCRLEATVHNGTRQGVRVVGVWVDLSSWDIRKDFAHLVVGYIDPGRSQTVYLQEPGILCSASVDVHARVRRASVCIFDDLSQSGCGAYLGYKTDVSDTVRGSQWGGPRGIPLLSS